jgi:hypothetical protein
MFVSAGSAIVERNVFTGLIELQGAGGGEASNKSRFSGELVRELARLEHRLSVSARGSRQSGIKLEIWRTDLLARLVRHLKQVLLGLEFVFVKRDVGSGSRGWLQGRLMRRLAVRGGPNAGQQAQEPGSKDNRKRRS